MNKNEGFLSTKFKIGAGVVGVGMVIGLIILIMCLTRVPAGFVGVVFSPNDGVKDQTLSSGWHIIAPFDKVNEYPVRIQTVEYKDIQVATSDGKSITMDFAYNYQVEQEAVTKIFNTFGAVPSEDLEQSYLRTRLRDAARKALAEFTVIDIYGEKSAEAGVKVQERFANDVNKLGFVVSNITVGVPQPDQKTQDAIDARVSASQELERKTTELQIAKKEAERKAAEAKGVADSTLIQAEAQAKANKLLEQSLTDQIVRSKAIDKWDGKMPVVSGSGVSPIVDMRTITGQEETKK